MNSIIYLLTLHNQFLIKQINFLLCFIAKNIPLNFKEDLSSPKYNRFVVDELPVIKTFNKLDFKELLSKYFTLHGKELKPVKSRGHNPIDSKVKCPKCGAPHDYLYDNTGGRGQIWCKVCDYHFSKKKTKYKKVSFICPHCGHTLSKVKKRTEFYIHKCTNNNCSYYLNSCKKLTKQDLLKKSNFKLRYIFREFIVDFFNIDLSSMPKNAVNLSFRKFSSHILGLCLTYHVNLGLSTRATAHALWEIHQVKISHVMVSKYASTAAALVKPFVDDYDYNPTNYLAADETYIKTKGVKNYVWFVMDAIKKSILGYQTSVTRSTGPCIVTMRKAFLKFKKFPGKALVFVSDGFTSYNLALQQFKLKGKDFDLIQVLGLTNEDAISTKFRWLKQNIERLNRTFKFSYKKTNGYGSAEGSGNHLALFVAYYNFLRPHTYKKWQPLNPIKELDNIHTMPAKWQKFIELSQQHILSKQSA